MIELDKRIISGKKPLTCFDAEQAQNFVGKKCYLTNDISLFANLDKFIEKEGCSNVTYAGVIDTFQKISTEVSMIFATTRLRWKFCIPCEWVTEEKAYRAYKNVQELFEDIGVYIGDTIHFKTKVDMAEYHSLITGWTETINGSTTVCFGDGRCFTMEELFDMFELRSRGGWIPFGKECEE